MPIGVFILSGDVIVAGKQPELRRLDMDAAIKHCSAGLGIWERASIDEGSDPDVVMACAGDVPALAAGRGGSAAAAFPERSPRAHRA